MLHRIMRMLNSRSPEFLILFLFQTSILFIWKPWFVFNAICISALCILYIPLNLFVIPSLPRWYRSKIGELPKFDAIQAVLCVAYSIAAWAPALWK